MVVMLHCCQDRLEVAARDLGLQARKPDGMRRVCLL